MMTANILALIDFSESTGAVVQTAGEQAKLQSAKCWLMHVAAPDPDFVGYEVGPQYIRDSRADVLKDEHKRLHELKESLTAQGVDCEALLVMGPLFDTIDAEINKLNVDLVVLGSHGRSKLYELLVGSVCEHLLRNARVPLLVIPSQA